jgi:hypothetical protein
MKVLVVSIVLYVPEVPVGADDPEGLECPRGSEGPEN